MMLDFTQMVAMFCPSRKGRPVVAVERDLASPWRIGAVLSIFPQPPHKGCQNQARLLPYHCIRQGI
jgi:hypothetical protein